MIFVRAGSPSVGANGKLVVTKDYVLRTAFNILKFPKGSAGPGIKQPKVPPCDKVAFEELCTAVNTAGLWAKTKAYRFTCGGDGEDGCGSSLWPVSDDLPAMPAAIKALQQSLINGTELGAALAPPRVRTQREH